MLDERCLCLYIIDDELRRRVLGTSVFRPEVIVAFMAKQPGSKGA